MQGMVTYSNEAKVRLLGVKEETLKAHGAVSRETALEMALGGAERAQTDVCVAVTGLAGPGGGKPGKPVGLVYMACAVKGKAEVLEYHFKGKQRKDPGTVYDEGPGPGTPLCIKSIMIFSDDKKIKLKGFRENNRN